MIAPLDEPAVVLTKLRAIREEIASGIYDPVQVVGVGNAFDIFLMFVNSKPGRRITRTALYDSLDVSKSVVSNVVSKRHSPKMENFFPIVNGLILNFESELGLRSFSIEAFQGVPSHYIKINSRSKDLAALIELLNELVEKIRGNNSREKNFLSDVERGNLILVLETALNHLRSPAIEVSFLHRLTGWLRVVAKKSVNKGVETLAGSVAGEAAAELAKLLKGL